MSEQNNVVCDPVQNDVMMDELEPYAAQSVLHSANLSGQYDTYCHGTPVTSRDRDLGAGSYRSQSKSIKDVSRSCFDQTPFALH